MPSTTTTTLFDLLDDFAMGGTVNVPVGAIGGAGDGWTRYVQLEYAYLADAEGGGDDLIEVSIYGVTVARVAREWIELRTAGHFTPSTRAALNLAVTGYQRPNGAVSMRTPGSKGGKPGPWRAVVHLAGQTYEVGADWTRIELGGVS